MNLNHTAFRKFDGDRKTLIKRRLHKVVTEAIEDMLEERITLIDDIGEDKLEHVNWPLLRAYRDGRIRELRELKKILITT